MPSTTNHRARCRAQVHSLTVNRSQAHIFNASMTSEDSSVHLKTSNRTTTTSTTTSTAAVLVSGPSTFFVPHLRTKPETPTSEREAKLTCLKTPYMIDSSVCVCVKHRAGSPIFWLNSVVKFMRFSLFQRRPVGKGKGRKEHVPDGRGSTLGMGDETT